MELARVGTWLDAPCLTGHVDSSWSVTMFRGEKKKLGGVNRHAPRLLPFPLLPCIALSQGLVSQNMAPKFARLDRSILKFILDSIFFTFRVTDNIKV